MSTYYNQLYSFNSSEQLQNQINSLFRQISANAQSVDSVEYQVVPNGDGTYVWTAMVIYYEIK